MKVYSKVGNTTHVLDASELWTADLSQGQDFTLKEAIANVEDFKAIAAEQSKKQKYWCGE